MSPSTSINKKRMMFAFLVICIICTGLAFRVGWIQVVSGEEYSKQAIDQQTQDVPIPAKRGSILDRNGNELAISAITHSVWVRPANLQIGGQKNAQENVDKAATMLSGILEMNEGEVRALITQKKILVKVAKYVEKDKVDQIRAQIKELELPGIEIAEDVKRYYPMGAFASQLLGSVTDDNRGLAGIELYYNDYLSGLPGRWIKSSDRTGNGLSYGTEKYYQAENGLSLVLTIDEVIQHIAEKAIKQVQTDTQANFVECLVMDPKTGDVLAMASTPGYDPNNPRVPLDEGQVKYVEGLSDSEKVDYWNKMWRNPLVNDAFEPGSTFKLLTTAMSLEEGLTNPNEGFNCTGFSDVYGTTLKCWRWYAPHGAETLTQAVGNSCNPVFIQLVERSGLNKFMEYMDLFGITKKTGIDYPGESRAILQEDPGPVDLATMSYGQGIAVTPVQLTTAISSLGNGGRLMQPRLVKELRDSDGNTVEKFEPKVVRQVVSKQTADEMRVIMEAAVEDGGVKKAKLSGYRIGGKTGTSYIPENGKYNEEDIWASFIGMAPMDDPQLAVFVMVDTPRGETFGSTVALPGGKVILEETLRYLNIKPSYTAEELAKAQNDMVTVPDCIGKNYSQVLSGNTGLHLKFLPGSNTGDNSDFAVVDQYPKAGEKIAKNGTVYLYRQ